MLPRRVASLKMLFTKTLQQRANDSKISSVRGHRPRIQSKQPGNSITAGAALHEDILANKSLVGIRRLVCAGRVTCEVAVASIDRHKRTLTKTSLIKDRCPRRQSKQLASSTVRQQHPRLRPSQQQVSSPLLLTRNSGCACILTSQSTAAATDLQIRTGALPGDSITP